MSDIDVAVLSFYILLCLPEVDVLIVCQYIIFKLLKLTLFLHKGGFMELFLQQWRQISNCYFFWQTRTQNLRWLNRWRNSSQIYGKLLELLWIITVQFVVGFAFWHTFVMCTCVCLNIWIWLCEMYRFFWYM